jgi:hypothetical protein
VSQQQQSKVTMFPVLMMRILMRVRVQVRV